MKPHFKPLAIALATAVLGGCMPALAAVPLRWTVETSRAAPTRIDVYRGETVTVAADLTSYGRPLELAGSVALYLQTNGMANTWWTVPANISSNRIEATLAPSAYPGDATLLNCYLGGPAVNYRAAFQARILGAPGPAPNTVQPPVVTLDFSAIEVANAPYWTKDEADSRFGGSLITASVVTNIAAAVAARDAYGREFGVKIEPSQVVVESYGASTTSGEYRADMLSFYDRGSMRYVSLGFDGIVFSGSDSIIDAKSYMRFADDGRSGVITTDDHLAEVLVPFAAAAQVATNAVPRTVADATYATKGEMSGKLDAANGTANYLTVTSPHDDKIILGTSEDERVNIVFGQFLALVFDRQARRFGVWPYPSADYSNLDFLATASDVLSMVDAIPMTYTNVAGIASVNCSVQVVVDPANNTLPTFQVPAAVPGGVRDWIVHVVSSGSADIAVTGFPTTVDGNKTANFFSAIAAADLTKACTHGAITTFTFTEINSTQSAVNFMVMRAELQRVSPSN